MIGRVYLLLFLAASMLAADPAWLRLSSAHFELITNAGARSGREALKRFEQIRQVFEARTERQNLTPLPARVFLFRNEADFRPYQVTPNAAGYYQSGQDRDYIAMQASGPDSYRVVYHEYAHMLMRHAGYVVPVWLNEGIAEVYSTISFAGQEVRIGDLIPSHIATLREEALLDLPTLLAVTQESPHYNERGKSGIFYAQSWALVHMLNFSSTYQPGMANFLSMVLSGEDPSRSFAQAFGKTMSDVQQDLVRYVRQDRFVGVRFRAPRSEAVGKAVAESVEAVEAELMLGDLLLAIRRDTLAAPLYDKLATAYPLRPEVHAALGDLALRRNDDAQARRQYERAIELGSNSGRVRFDLAMLLREAGEPPERIFATLEDAVAKDPRLFDAYHFMGYLALEAQQYGRAIDALSKAVAIDGGRAAAWEYLALAHHHSGQKDKARVAAEKARRLVSKPEDAARIDATIRLIEQGLDATV